MPAKSPLDVADGALGQLVERLTTSHHRRRLARVRWTTAIDPPPGGWVEGEPPPRPGNALSVLVDGAEAFRAMADAIENAQSHVHVTGWHVTPDFALTRDGAPTILRRVLADVATRIPVRVLIWAGAPLPVLRPWRGDVRAIREQLVTGTGVQCALDARERPMHCHHEKTIVVDDRVAFVGGIDLTSFNGDRWDTPLHPPRGAIGWHDVAARITGPAVQDVARNFSMRWEATTGERLPAASAPTPTGDVELQLVRTVPDGMYRHLPKGEFRILESYLRGLRAAQRFAYLENQFLWSPEILAVLRDKLARPPTPDFRVVLVLPAKPDSGGDHNPVHARYPASADGDRGRLLGCKLYATGRGRDWPVFLPAKGGIVAG